MRPLASFTLLLSASGAAAAAAAAEPSSSATTTATATCPSASANVITNRLPQQCLRSNWTSSAPPSHNATSSTTLAASSAVATPTIALSPSPESPIPQSSPSKDTQPVSGLHEPGTPSEYPSSTGSASEPAAAATPQDDQDSFLDAAKFLSFEDWKKQKIGEAADYATLQSAQHQPRQRPGEGFDTLGEESEISLDFGFAEAVRPAAGGSPSQPPMSGGASGQTAVPSSAARLRNKDAGRTCKERFNYASFDCAASVLKTNSKCKSSTSVLVENKDSYMLNECSTDNKFLIVELCEHVEIDTIVLANFEFFSSMFRTFRVSASDRYPVKIDKWVTLGTFEARNTREIQAFLVENPMVWARYLRIEFLSHYGNEFYCPLSLLRVHGTNMVEDFRRMTDSGEDADESETALVPVAEPALVPSPATGAAERPIEAPATTPLPSEKASEKEPPADLGEQEKRLTLQSCLRSPLQHTPDICRVSLPAPAPAPPSKIASTFAFTQDAPKPQLQPNGRTGSSSNVQHSETSTAVISQQAETSTSTSSSSSASASSAPTPSSSNAAVPSNQAADSTSVPASSPSIAISSSSTKQSQPQPSSATTIAVAANNAASKSASAAKVIVASQKEHSPSPQPAGQESIFKSITKRLALLEANATLSLQYIESQSALLRSAFSATNSQQLNKTAIFLEKLNATVLTELSRAKADYDQLWQSTVLELHDQREESRKEREVLGERVRMLAEEVVGTKRLMAAQATLLLVALGLFVFTRNAPLHDGNSNSVDLRFLSNSVSGFMGHGRSRSHVKDANARSTSGPRNRWQWEVMSPWISPPQSRPGTSASFGRDTLQLDGRRSSDDSGPDRRDKPLPPRPSLESDDGDHSDATSERRDTVTQRNYRPALRLDPTPPAPAAALSPLSPDDESPAQHLSPDSIASASSAHHGLLRDVQSAPTTPSIATADMSVEDKGLDAALAAPHAHAEPSRS